MSTTTSDLPVEQVIAGAAESNLKSVIVIGETQDGGEYVAMSLADGPDNLWMMARAQKALLATVDKESDDAG